VAVTFAYGYAASAPRSNQDYQSAEGDEGKIGNKMVIEA
jgi:hypothetical protein